MKKLPILISALFLAATSFAATYDGVIKGEGSGLTNLNATTAFGSGQVPSSFLPPGQGGGLTNAPTIQGALKVLQPYPVGGSPIFINTNVGPGLDDYYGFLRVLGDSQGMEFGSQLNFQPWGAFDPLGFFTVGQSFANSPQFGWGNGEFMPSHNGIFYGSSDGAGATSFSALYGGSAAALTDLPTHGPEIWQSMPFPLNYFTVVFDWPGWTATSDVITQYVGAFNNSGLTAALVARGANPILHFDVAWCAPVRTNGVLGWNANVIEGMPFLTKYCHTNNAKLHLGQYYWAIPTNGTVTVYGSGTGLFPPTGFTCVATTPTTMSQDITTLMAWGVDGVRPSDINSQVTSGYAKQCARQWADAVINPNGLPWQTYNPYFNLPIFLEMIYGTYTPYGGGGPGPYTDDLPWLCNASVGDQQTYLFTVANQVPWLRYAWQYFAWKSGRGHWVCPFGLIDVASTFTTSGWQFGLSCASLWGANIQITRNWFTGPGGYHIGAFTNANWMPIEYDPGGYPAWMAQDNGSNSIWVKALSSGCYAALMVNEGNVNWTPSLSWTNLNPPGWWTPITAPPAYTLGQSNMFDVVDVWAGTDYGPHQGSYSPSPLAQYAWQYVLLEPYTNFFTGNLQVITNGTSTATMHFTNGMVMKITAP